MARSKNWCDICRDEKPEVRCTADGCYRQFHTDCLLNTGLADVLTDFSEYICVTCQEEDTDCYRCHRHIDDAVLLICDVCNRGAHLGCVGLTVVPESEEWECPVCSRESQAKTVKSSRAGGGRSILGNVDICYVCQKGGKLLCCDLCDQSFHPKCIDPDFLEASLREDEDKWGCPICKVLDPLKNMGHKRMTKAERQRQSAECQQCVKVQSKRCRANRDRFLWDSRAALKPFVSADILARLRKSAAPAVPAPKPQSRVRRNPPPPPVNLLAPPVGRRTTSNSLRVAMREAEEAKRQEEQQRLCGVDEQFVPPPKRLRRKRVNSVESVASSSSSSSKSSHSRSDDNGPVEVRAGRSFKRRRVDSDSDASSGVVDKRCAIVMGSSDESEHIHPARPDQSIDVCEPSMANGASGVDTTTPVLGPLDSEAVPIASLGRSVDDMAQSSRDTGPLEGNTLSVSYQEDTLLTEAQLSGKELLREGVVLKNYQRWGTNWLLDAFEHKAGAILADEMGLGKTIQTLAFLAALKCRGITGPHLVVVPLSTVGNWGREIKRFTPSLSCTKICGSRQERDHSMSDAVALDGIYDIYITTYETCVTEEWFFTDRFKWQCVVLDEAHRIRNEAARIRHSLDRVDCNMRVLLTGTPLQNNIKELFTLLNFLFPDVFRNSQVIEEVFQEKRAAKKKSGNDAKNNLLESDELFDDSTVDAITCLLSKLMLRRTKDLVVRLPKKIERDIWLPLSPAAARWYRLLLEVTSDMDQGSIKKLLGAVTKMRITCCHPRGLVSRPIQYQSLFDNITGLQWPDTRSSAIKAEANELKRTDSGWSHVTKSSKLIFLDKLLCQLHRENMEYSPTYKADFETTRANRLRKEINDRREKLEALVSGDSASAVETTGKDEGTLKAVEVGERLRKELDILERPEEEGGGLRGLYQDIEFPAVDSAESAHQFVDYLFPSDGRAANVKKEGVEEMSSEMADIAEEAASFVRPHKVLVFTQFQLALAELEAYCQWRNWSYMRLDGSTNKMIRELDTREFNSPDSTHFVFLISTRAGGLGINLVTANHVVLFDEDWNPFVDLQAIDRAHRIGQTRNVLIWKLMTEWTVEERMAIRRQQKLKLDKLLIQANVENLELQDEASEGSPEDKLSADEIRRLVEYGRTALLELSVTSGVEEMTLEELILRGRRDLKDLEMQKTSEKGPMGIEGEDTIDVRAALLEEDSATPPEVQREETDTSSVVDKEIRNEIELDDDDIQLEIPDTPQDDYLKGLQTRRRRVKPKLVYQPTSWAAKPKVERKLVRERRCFRCGDGGPVTWKVPERGRKTNKEKHPKDADPLVGCMRCPKVYHQSGCLGFDKPPQRSWVCPWHECKVCFRRSAAAGGLLIHCAECPTAFCFDCFPPEYRRYVPPPQFFEDLKKRGWPVTSQKLVTFLCSRCKALKEQERRRKLTKQQLEDENRKRKSKEISAREEARTQQSRKLARGEKQKITEERKLFMEGKRKADEEEKKQQDKLRTAIENLYPKRYLQIITQRRAHFLRQAAKAGAKLPEGAELEMEELGASEEKEKEVVRDEGTQMEEKDVSKEEQTDAKEKAKESGDGTTGDSTVQTGLEAGAAGAEPTDQKGKKQLGKRRIIIPDRYRRPVDMIKLCENCLLPRHEATQCPFPQETTRQRHGDLEPTSMAVGDGSAQERTGDSTNQEMHEPTATPSVKVETTQARHSGAGPTTETPQVVVQLSNRATSALVQDHEAADKSRRLDGGEAAGASEVIGDMGHDEDGQPVDSPLPRGRGGRKLRAVCIVCRSSTQVHARRHCPLLSSEDKEQYASRRERVAKLLEHLEAEAGCAMINTPSRLSDIWDAPDFDPMSLSDKFLDLTRRQLAFGVERVVERILKDVGLGECVPPDPSREFPPPSTSSKPKVQTTLDGAIKEKSEKIKPPGKLSEGKKERRSGSPVRDEVGPDGRTSKESGANPDGGHGKPPDVEANDRKPAEGGGSSNLPSGRKRRTPPKTATGPSEGTEGSAEKRAKKSHATKSKPHPAESHKRQRSQQDGQQRRPSCSVKVKSRSSPSRQSSGAPVSPLMHFLTHTQPGQLPSSMPPSYHPSMATQPLPPIQGIPYEMLLAVMMQGPPQYPPGMPFGSAAMAHMGAPGTPHMGTPHIGTPHIGTPHMGTPHMGTPHMGSSHMTHPTYSSTPVTGSPHVGAGAASTNQVLPHQMLIDAENQEPHSNHHRH